MDLPTKIVEMIDGVAVLKTNQGNVCQCPIATQYPTQAKIAGGGIQFIANPCTSNCPLFMIHKIPGTSGIKEIEKDYKLNLNLCHNTYFDIEVREAAKPPLLKPLGKA